MAPHLSKAQSSIFASTSVDNSSITTLEAQISTKPTIVLPSDKWMRSKYVNNLVLTSRVIYFKYSASNAIMHFVWKIEPKDDMDSNVIDQSYKVRDQLLKTIPVYHTRAMRSEFIHSFGRVTGIKSAILREAYKRLTVDQSAAETSNEELVDQRVKEMLDMENPDLIWGLRVNNEGQPEQYTEFLGECKGYIEGTVQTQVDDRRHDDVQTEKDGSKDVITHLATAMSVRELHRSVSCRLPEVGRLPHLVSPFPVFRVYHFFPQV